MKNTKMLQILQDFGLDENESAVYFTALSLGPTTVLKIAQTAELKRTTVYSVIDSLKQKGLITVEMKGFKQRFVAENPAILENILETKRERFKNALPEFLAMYNLKGGESFIKFYEGLESMKNSYEELLKNLKPHDFYLVISHSTTWEELDKDWFHGFLERRAKLKLDCRVLLQESEFATRYKKFEKNYSSLTKIMPPETSISTTMIITPNRILIHQLNPPIMAIQIDNKSIIQLQKEMFEIIWSSLP